MRATLAAYAQALDDGRTEDVLATFCDDGSVDIPGMGSHEGREALRGCVRQVDAPPAPTARDRQHAHHRWDDHEAEAVSDLVFLLKGEAGWVVQVVGRYHDLLHHEGDTWRFHSRRAEFAS